MWDFETTHLPQAPSQPIIWKRFIDDILCVFKEEDDTAIFNEWLNSLHPTIKFTSETGKSISFLDTYLTIEPLGQVRIRPFLKSTDTKQYLDPSSCHPPHNIKSIPYSQAIRIIRICNQKEDLDRELDNLFGYFKNRKYRPSLIKKAFSNALKSKEKQPHEEKQTKGKGPTLVIPYNPNNPNYQACINKVWKELGEHVNLDRPMVAHTRPKNLKDILTKARLSTDVRPKPRLQPKSLATYSKTQIEVPIRYVTFRCESDHRLTTDKFENMGEAWKTIMENDIEKLPFLSQHQSCGRITCTQTPAISHITTKCTDCKFTYNFTTDTTPTKFEEEIRYVVDTMQRALHRKKWKSRQRCKNISCDACKHISKKKEITWNNTNYRTLEPNCELKNIIYFVECEKCQLLYIGQTTSSLKKRLSGHKHNAKNMSPYTMGTHFREPEHSINDLKIGILDTGDSKMALDYKEAFWIHILETVDKGLNRRDERDKKLTIQTTHITKHFNHSNTCFPYIISHIHQLSDNN